MPTATRSLASAGSGCAAPRPESAIKSLVVAPIDHREAIGLVTRWHYSGSYCRNSQLHLGVFDGPRLVGAMQFGPPLDRRKMLGLVPDSRWHDVLELNRMALAPEIGRNAESRVIAIACRMLRRHAPQVRWIISFADAGQCGDGTIYRAAGFHLTGIKWTEFVRLKSGKMVHRLAVTANCSHALGGAASVGEFARRAGATRVKLPSVRYIKLLDPAARLASPPLPYSALTEAGVRCYKGRRTEATRSEIIELRNSIKTKRAGSVLAHAPRPAGRGRFDSDPGASAL